MDWPLCGNILMRNWISFSEGGWRPEAAHMRRGILISALRASSPEGRSEGRRVLCLAIRVAPPYLLDCG